MALNERLNIARATDAYKPTQVGLDPNGIEFIMEYMTARGGVRNRAQFFGLQYYMKEYLEGKILTEEKIAFAEKQCMKNYGIPYFRADLWRGLLKDHGGKLPISIRAVPEGMVVPKRNVLVTVVNTDPKYAWLVPYMESILLDVHRPSTVATLDAGIQEMAKWYADMCGEPVPICIDNDFGYRAIGEEDAKISGMAHLVNSVGGDTFVAFDAAEEYYGGDKSGVVMLTVRATEHHTMQTWGQENELEAYQEIIKRTPSNAILSLVTDTWNFREAQRHMLGFVLKDMILAREGKIVFRPDSGYPPQVAVESLYGIAEDFGYTTNTAGYKVCNPKVGLLMGDKISYPMMKQVLEAVVVEEKFAISNIVFGMGGQRYNVTRDTLGFTMKECAYRRNGTWFATSKNPDSDAYKKSQGGRLKLIRENGKYKTVDIDEPGDDLMVEVFRDGKILKEWTFAEVKANAAI
jgi:nicotinamide phosphoribosyltransferase